MKRLRRNANSLACPGLRRAEARNRLLHRVRKKCNLTNDSAAGRAYINRRSFFGKYHWWAHVIGACRPKSYCRLKWNLQMARLRDYEERA